jgi:hypothetical protein
LFVNKVRRDIEKGVGAVAVPLNLKRFSDSGGDELEAL